MHLKPTSMQKPTQHTTHMDLLNAFIITTVYVHTQKRLSRNIAPAIHSKYIYIYMYIQKTKSYVYQTKAKKLLFY